MSHFRHALPRHSWWIALVWLAVGVITATQVVVGMAALGRHLNWTSLFFTTAAAWLFWAVATPFILFLSRRFPMQRASDWRNGLLHRTAALAISVGPCRRRNFQPPNRAGRFPNRLPASVKPLIVEPLESIGHPEVRMISLTAPPGAVLGADQHPGQVFAYVVKGVVESQAAPGSPRVYSAGEAFYAPPPHAHPRLPESK